MQGYRKFAVALASIVSASILVACKAIDHTVYATVMTVVVGGYMTANVAQRAVATKAQA